jgi:hypothetical protein
MPRSWANAESTKYRALLAGPLFFHWACTRAIVSFEDDIKVSRNSKLLAVGEIQGKRYVLKSM